MSELEKENARMTAIERLKALCERMTTWHMEPWKGMTDYANELSSIITDIAARCEVLADLDAKLQAERERYSERVAQLTAHRVCIGTEHDPEHGKLHGCCVVCGVPWPCEYAGKLPNLDAKEPHG